MYELDDNIAYYKYILLSWLQITDLKKARKEIKTFKDAKTKFGLFSYNATVSWSFLRLIKFSLMGK